jgi:NADPH2:quinone reductase
MVAKEWKSVRLPENIAFEVGATVIHSYDTAYYALVDRAQLKAGETVLITGAGGGVGMAAVDVARHLGGRVIAAVASARHTAALYDRGVSEIIDYTQEGFRERLGALTAGKWVDVCFDNVGGPLFATLARSMAWRGRLLPIGFTGGDVPMLAMNLPLLKNFSVVGVFAGAWEDKEPEAARLAKETVMDWVAAGHLHPHVGLVVPLERAAEAMKAIGDRTTTGRIVVKVR